MIIRKATQKDLNIIQQLNNELFELELEHFDTYLTKNWPLSKQGYDFFENAITNDLVLVAQIDDNVIGYLHASKADIPYYDFEIAELCNMCITKTYRKQGIGKKLYDEFVSYYNSQSVNHFIVTASYKNESAQAFYKKLGFKPANITYINF